MKKLILITVSCILFSTLLVAQSVGINNNTPHSSAILDVQSSTRGMLIPRTSTTSRMTIINPAKGLMLYDTTTSSFWFYNGSTWSSLSVGNNGWNLTGNTVINPSSHFIGTINEQPLRFRINDSWAGELHPTSRNVFLGLGAGQANTTGQANTAIGQQTLVANTIGFNNSASGYQALYFNTTGYHNTANGYRALYSNTSGDHNTANGADALWFNTAGSYNTANGYGALVSNTTGYYNTASGANALISNISGSNNTANGYEALYSNTTGTGNSAIGNHALYSNTTGDYNTANGSSALYSNITGFSNTANGSAALYSNTSGDRNTANGSAALYSNTSGDRNTAYGLYALSVNTTGDNNIAIGTFSGTADGAFNLSNTIGIGNDGSFLNLASNQVIIGNSSTTYIGGKVNWGVVSDARIKNRIKEDVKGLEFILKLRPVTYHISNKAINDLTKTIDSTHFEGKYDGEKVTYTGFIAQEVEQAAIAAEYNFSGYTKPGSDREMYTIRYAEFVVPLVKAMQEQQTIIEELKKEIELLKKKK